jgi:hypothetical protein
VLEHASVAKVFIANDPETGTWGIWPGWEAPPDYLGRLLRGELPAASAAEWREPTPEDVEVANWRGHAWANVVETALTSSHTETTSARKWT